MERTNQIPFDFGISAIEMATIAKRRALRDAQTSGRQEVAGSPQTVPHALHANKQFVAERDRTLVP